jgi:4-hydroxyphenylpyruvate dioxygenase
MRTRKISRPLTVPIHPEGFGLSFIDHLTHNLISWAAWQKWADYYERLFNFREIRYFDIKGAKTGLLSKAMTAPDGIVRIPLNESSDPKIADQRVSGRVQRRRHPAYRAVSPMTSIAAVEAMRAAGVKFLDTPKPISR